VDYPIWMIESFDREASRLGVPRQSRIKVLIARHLEEASKPVNTLDTLEISLKK